MFILVTLETVKNIMKTYNFLRPLQKFVDICYPSLPDDYLMSGVCNDVATMFYFVDEIFI